MTDTINIPRAELQAALDALQECRQKIAYLLGNIEWYEPAQAIDFADISIKAISARLAQQEETPKPVGWISKNNVVYPLEAKDEVHPVNELRPLYTTPPKQEEKAADPCADGSCDCRWADKEPEPHSWYSTEHDEWMTDKTRREHERLNSYTHRVCGFALPLYTTPPQRPWQGLTGEEINTIAATPAAIPGSYVHSFARAIEAKLKEKNT